MTDDGGGARVQEMTRELDVLLGGISRRIAVSAQAVSLPALAAPSGRLYGAITRHWPRIAAGLVGLSVVLDFVLGSVEVGGSLDFYVFAWASTTGGLWFLFDKAEKALSDESRAKVVGWVKEADLKSTIASVPAQFALLFDRVFGEKHLSRHCFNRSCVASALSFLVVWVALLPTLPNEFIIGGFNEAGPLALIGLYAASVPFNFFPDYLSLLETRWAIGLMARTGRVWGVLLLDVVATSAVSILGMAVVAAVFIGLPDIVLLLLGTPTGNTPALLVSGAIQAAQGAGPYAAMGFPIKVAFLSAFFTSAWLWIYVGAVYAARVLLRMNSGVGFLLRATDVERQPFRSVGFVSVIITSALFLLALPLVLF